MVVHGLNKRKYTMAAKAPKAGPAISSNNVVYTDLVVMDFSRDPEKGFPIKSFHVHQGKQDMKTEVELAKAFIQHVKLQALHKGENIPDLRLGRTCAVRNTQDTVIDYSFETHKLGITPMDDPALSEGPSALASSLSSIAQENPL